MQQPKQTKHQGAAFAPYLHRGQIVPFKVRGVTAAYKREHTPSVRRNGLQQPVTLRSDATPISASSSKTLLQNVQSVRVVATKGGVPSATTRHGLVAASTLLVSAGNARRCFI